MAVLSATAGLLDELAFDFLAGAPDGLAVSDLGRADVGFHAEFALHAVDDDLQVQLAHARDDGLAGFLVRAHAERRVLLRQAVEGDAHFLLVALGLRFHGNVDHRFRKHHAFQDNDVLGIAQGFAGGHVFQPHRSPDVAGAHFLDFSALVGVHLQQAADALLLAAHRV